MSKTPEKNKDLIICIFIVILIMGTMVLSGYADHNSNVNNKSTGHQSQGKDTFGYGSDEYSYDSRDNLNYENDQTTE
jgi:hypothetical protein